MIIYRCDECGDDIAGTSDGTPRRIRWEAVTLLKCRLHFCSLQCAGEWADISGYRDEQDNE